MSNIHICLISEQILPNLIPILSDPENVKGFITFSGDSTLNKNKRRLIEILETKHIPCLKSVSAKNSFDYPTLYESACKLKKQLTREHSDDTWVFNLTNGTKMMFVALYNAFIETPQAQLIYIDTQHSATRYFEHTEAAKPLPDVINLKTYLKAQNFIITNNPATDPDEIAYMAARKHLIDNIFMKNIYQPWLLASVFNSIASKASSATESLTQKCKHKIRKEAIPYIEELAQAGLFTWTPNNATFTFTNKESAAFIGGGWLEEYAYWCAIEAGLDANHIGINVEGYWDKDIHNTPSENPKNEFDLLLCYRNQILVIECKTVANIEYDGSDIIYKVDALGKRLRGLYGTSMLLSSAKIASDDTKTAHIADRLKSYNLDCVSYTGLRNLTEDIKRWMNKCEFKSK